MSLGSQGKGGLLTARLPWNTRPLVEADSARLLQNLRDYADAAFALIWQRQAIFLAVAVLTAFFFSPWKAVLFYAALLACEAQDLMIARTVSRLSPADHRGIRRSLVWVLVNTAFSAGAIGAYVVSIASLQDYTGYFTPLFFLFAAALFAAMNNHQIVLALVMRITIYGVAFLYIASKDLFLAGADPAPELWLQFLTVVFVLYFLIDCSVQFLKLYRRNLAQLEALRLEHERTKAAYVVKSQFVSIVSHELRTPLTSIKGSLDLINSGRLGQVPGSMVPLVEMAGKNSRRLATLIDDLLDLQKMEAGEMRFQLAVVPVQALVAEALQVNECMAQRFGVRLVQGAMPADPVHVEADPARLGQVLTNLISNAAKFSAPGSAVTVGCELVADGVRIMVEDHGIGMPEGVRERIFDRFTQLDSSDHRRVGGTGLGLSIAQEIVARLGGQIDYETELGVGTTFFVTFPTVAAPAAPLPSPGERRAALRVAGGR